LAKLPWTEDSEAGPIWRGFSCIEIVIKYETQDMKVIGKLFKV